jgi:hypothetical protein
MPFVGSAGGGIEAGASDLNPMAENACAWLSGGRRQWPAASGGATRRRARIRAPGHGSTRERHLRAARRAAKPMGTTVAVEKRRSGGTTRRRGSQTPARSLKATGVHGIETNGTGRLPTFLRRSWMAHGDEQAMAAGKQRRRRKPRVLVAAAHGVWRLGHGWRRSRGGATLNSPDGARP